MYNTFTRVIDLNNKLRLAEGELKAEEFRILKLLSASLGSQARQAEEFRILKLLSASLGSQARQATLV
ncbi:hypothetical protein T484DRAFT_1804694 [Baffinella frigidus]|nr:hypothetical protein T484DRAFT_1804694 [Cryptophyta sp. CCMP2293]